MIFAYQTVEWNFSHSFEEISDCAQYFCERRIYYPYPGSRKITSDEIDDWYAAHRAINDLLRGARP